MILGKSLNWDLTSLRSWASHLLFVWMLAYDLGQFTELFKILGKVIYLSDLVIV
jgi:hypothetical protein